MRPPQIVAPRSPLAMLMIVTLCLGAASCARAQPTTAGPAPGEPTEGLQAFHSDQELVDYLRRHRPQERYRDNTSPTAPAESADAAGAPPPMTSAAPPPPPAAQSEAMGRAAQPGAIGGVRGADGSITNNQVQGVDEGDIVKLRGDLLVILRRGRLFTVSIAGGTMRPVSQLDVTPPGAQATTSDWYDEMLISGDRVIVIGYSYRRRGTDIYRFRIDRSGKLSFEDAYQLRSSDYYSDRNYASRMIGNQLILYTPLPIAWQGDDPLQSLPAIRRWRTTDDQDGYRRIAEPGSVYIPGRLFYAGDARVTTFHTVTRCDVTAPVLDCHATSVLGNQSRSFYVSASAVYVWTAGVLSGRTRDHDAGALIYRMPLSGRRPAAVAARGAPIDQFSFREDTDTGMLNVLVRSEGGGDAMWSSEFTPGRLSLLRFPISAFGKGDAEVGHGFYRFLPPASQPFALHDRYVGPYLLYGAATADYGDQRQDGQAGITAVPVAGGPITNLKLASGVDRIEALGGDAVAVGSTNQDVIFTTIELTGGGGAPTIGDRYVRRDASEGETRSHGFFYHPDADSADGQDGILGLPIAKRASPAYQSLFTSSAAMVYLRRSDRRLSPMGELEAADTGIVDDECRASCVDWYGNARPIFVGNRVFALLGYELVEGGVRGTQIRETGRVSFAPEPNGPPPAEE
jgi:hypothetical protein